MEMLVRTLEEAALHASPTLETRFYDGWLLRYANGYTRGANAVYPMYGSTLELDEKISYCEAYYAHKKQPAQYRITPLTFPSGLDEYLIERGYSKEDPTGVYIFNLLSAATFPEDNARVEIEWKKEWLQAFCRFRGLTDYIETVRTTLEKITLPACFLAVYHHNEIVSVGLGVQDGEWIGLYRIATAPEARRQGYARAVVNSLLYWGKENGAQKAYLRTGDTNLPAIHLYETTGFIRAYSVWYRSQPIHYSLD